MKSKTASLLVLLSLFMSVLLFAESGAVLTEAVSTAVCAVPAGRNPVTGSGNISIEADNVEAICSKIQEVVKKHGAVMKNFNINVDSNSKYKNAYMEAGMDIALAPAFMNDIIALGEIKSHNYNEQTQPDNADDLKKQLAELNDKYEKMLQKKPDIEVSKAIVSKIVEVENRIRNLQYSEGNEGKARIYINVQQPGQNKQTTSQGTAGRLWPFLITAIIFLALGIFSRNLAIKKSTA